MSGSRHRFDELGTGWALRALTGTEVEELRELLADDPGRVTELRELEETALHLALDPELVEPPARLRRNLVAAVRATGESEPRTSWSDRLGRALGLDRTRIALAATGALLALLTGLAFHAVELRRDVETARQGVIDLSQSLAERQRLLEVLQSARVELVALDGLEDYPEAAGKILWDPEGRVALLQLSGLPALPEGETYQFWVYPRDGEPASAAVFAVDSAQQEAFFRLDRFPAGAPEVLSGFLVTREPAGGTSEPGERYVLGARLPE